MGRGKRPPPRPRLVAIQRLDARGRGRTRLDGRDLQVHLALPGEQVVVEPRGRRPRHAVAQRVLAPAARRVLPRCPHYAQCGGCSLMHLEPAAQLELKQQRLLSQLTAAGVTPDAVLPPLAGPTLNYRRRARLGARYVIPKERVLVGFRERGSGFVAEMATCHVLVEPLARLVAPLAALVDGLSLRDRLPQIELAAGDREVALVLRVLDPPTAEDRVRLAGFAAEHGVALCLQPGGLDSAVALDGGPLPELHYALPGFDLEFAFGPLDFVQVNGVLNRELVATALALLAPEPCERVLDLFCGIGNFSLPLARRAGAVLGLEGSAASVGRATANAARNGIGNARFAVRDLYGPGGEPLVEPGERIDKVLVDPPRSGLGAAAEPLAALGAGRIVYVSCHPESLAADAAVLVQRHGYRLRAAGVVDMFPHTAHAEAIALFER